MLIVSSKLQCDGDIVAIIDVLVLPPKESCNKRVSFDSLKKNNNNLKFPIYYHKHLITCMEYEEFVLQVKLYNDQV